MLVETIHNNENNIPKELRHYAWGQSDDGKLPLSIGKKYVVSGIQTNNNHKFYLIIPDDEELNGSPWWYPVGSRERSRGSRERFSRIRQTLSNIYHQCSPTRA